VNALPVVAALLLGVKQPFRNVMKVLVKLLLFTFLSGSLGFAYADYDLLVKKNCLACHSVDKRKYGPKLSEVASKYVGDKDAVKKLAKKIKAGGKGVWGEDVMPPQPQVTKAEAQILAKYVLSLKQ
jgi:cytochrome c